MERKEISGDETKWIQKLVCPEENVCPSQSGIIDVSYSVTVLTRFLNHTCLHILEYTLNMH